MLAGVFALIEDPLFRRITFSEGSDLLGGIVSRDLEARQADARWLALRAELAFDDCAVGPSLFRS